MDLLAKNLQFLTQTPGKGQTEAAAAIGVRQPAISKIARGETVEPGIRTVAGLAAFYGVSIDDLVGRDLAMAGIAPPSQSVGLDVDKLVTLIETVEAAIERSGRRVPARTKARLLSALYRDDQASAASSAQAVQAALASILATLEET